MTRIDQLSTLLDADPNDADVLYMLAQEHAKGGDVAASVEHYNRCIAIDPAYHYAYYHKARALESNDDQAAAIETLQAGLTQARADGADKAISEIQEYLASLEG